jgi:redox-sensitive bicupin YhaK (pirin superfamily)
MPVIDGPGYSVKVALGASNSICSATSPSTPMTILNGTIQPGGRFTHETDTDRGIWVQAIEGSVDVVVSNNERHLTFGQAIAIKAESNVEVLVSNPSCEPARFVLFDGARIGETFVQEGTFVMGSQHQIDSIKAAYEAGELSTIANNR